MKNEMDFVNSSDEFALPENSSLAVREFLDTFVVWRKELVKFRRSLDISNEDSVLFVHIAVLLSKPDFDLREIRSRYDQKQIDKFVYFFLGNLCYELYFAGCAGLVLSKKSNYYHSDQQCIILASLRNLRNLKPECDVDYSSIKKLEDFVDSFDVFLGDPDPILLSRKIRNLSVDIFGQTFPLANDAHINAILALMSKKNQIYALRFNRQFLNPLDSAAFIFGKIVSSVNALNNVDETHIIFDDKIVSSYCLTFANVSTPVWQSSFYTNEIIVRQYTIKLLLSKRFDDGSLYKQVRKEALGWILDESEDDNFDDARSKLASDYLKILCPGSYRHTRLNDSLPEHQRLLGLSIDSVFYYRTLDFRDIVEYNIDNLAYIPYPTIHSHTPLTDLNITILNLRSILLLLKDRKTNGKISRGVVLMMIRDNFFVDTNEDKRLALLTFLMLLLAIDPQINNNNFLKIKTRLSKYLEFAVSRYTESMPQISSFLSTCRFFCDGQYLSLPRFVALQAKEIVDHRDDSQSKNLTLHSTIFKDMLYENLLYYSPTKLRAFIDLNAKITKQIMKEAVFKFGLDESFRKVHYRKDLKKFQIPDFLSAAVTILFKQ